jgi:hypothetical protein
MSTNSPADCSALILQDLHALAIQTGLILRKSPKFSANGFLQSLLGSTVTGLGSSNQIAAELKARVGHSMSRQSLHERFVHFRNLFQIKFFEIIDSFFYRFLSVTLIRHWGFLTGRNSANQDREPKNLSDGVKCFDYF